MDQREVQQGMVASVAQGQHTGCIVSFKGTYRSGCMSHIEAQRRGPANCLCQQEPHGCGNQVCQHRNGTSSHRLCLPMSQHLSTGKELRSRERPQTTGDDCHEEPCECATMSSEDAAGATEIRCHHQVLTREGNATGQCP